MEMTTGKSSSGIVRMNIQAPPNGDTWFICPPRGSYVDLIDETPKMIFPVCGEPY